MRRMARRTREEGKEQMSDLITSWHSYPSIFNVGHSAIRDLFAADVYVEEKVDGSQFSFGVFGGEIKCRSKGREIILDAPEKMFALGVETARRLAESGILHDGWTYRGEYLQKPKHNALAYDRIPRANVILFDVNTGHEEYLPREAKEAEAERIGLECVPFMFRGRIETAEQFLALLDNVSILGGAKIEGVVCKQGVVTFFGEDKKALMAKFVGEAFREIHKGEWRKDNPTGGDIEAQLVMAFRTPARWAKAVQHLRERGELQNDPRDIGALIKEVGADIRKECREEIAAMLLGHYLGKVVRGATGGLPEWYKEQLVKGAFK